MGFRYVVLGAGRQGTAAAYDLLLHGEGDSVLLVDRDPAVADAAAARVNALLHRPGASAFEASLDARNQEKLVDILEGHHGVFSALPYVLNPGAARAALLARAHFCDLGGNTAIVREVIAMDSEARTRGVSLVPDCGLAPGFSNVLAAAGIARLASPKKVHIRCGGLPRHPKPPLGYKLVFDIAGLTNEYTGFAECLRDGRIVMLPALSEIETLVFPEPVGRCEAFLTSGGTSTCCETWAGTLDTYDYKTVRYPGHVVPMQAILALGLLELDPVRLSDGTTIVPRDVFHACATPRLLDPEDTDLVVLRVACLGEANRERIAFDVLDFQDMATGFLAMERCTAFPAAATLHLQVRGSVPSGAQTPERCVRAEALLRSVRERGIVVAEST